MLRDTLRLSAALALLGAAAVATFFLSRAGTPLPAAPTAAADRPGTPYVADVEGICVVWCDLSSHAIFSPVTAGTWPRVSSRVARM